MRGSHLGSPRRRDSIFLDGTFRALYRDAREGGGATGDPCARLRWPRRVTYEPDPFAEAERDDRVRTDGARYRRERDAERLDDPTRRRAAVRAEVAVSRSRSPVPSPCRPRHTWPRSPALHPDGGAHGPS